MLTKLSRGAIKDNNNNNNNIAHIRSDKERAKINNKFYDGGVVVYVFGFQKFTFYVDACMCVCKNKNYQRERER